MFNPTHYENAAPAGFGVLELVVDPDAPTGPDVIERPPRPHWPRVTPREGATYAPLERTDLRGTITGPVASLRLVQRFRVPAALAGRTVEARYRFPLPGDAAVTGVVVRFGETEVRTTLRARADARAEYDAAKAAGHQAVLLEREAADVFTLSVAGLRDAETIEVETRYVQRAALAGGRWSVRVPLTTAPRFVRRDEGELPQAKANPLAVLRDPGHCFALDVTVHGADGPLAIASPTHALRVEAGGEGTEDGRLRVRLDGGDVAPDRDCVLEWRAAMPNGTGARPALEVVAEDGPDGAFRYVLALLRPPAAAASRVARDLVLLVDRSGSMEGAKWQATRWAIRRLLAGLGPDDRVQLGAFDTETVWLGDQALVADARTRDQAERFLDAHAPRGGTELGQALEAALLRRPRGNGRAVARHCLVVTDGQVTDEGRILAVVEREAERADARRVSVLCIDSAPNASLASAVAERGRGTAHFLSSDPSDGDVATALEDVLEVFDAPLAAGLTLAVDRPDAEAASRPAVRAGGVTRLDLGDLVAGRPAWAVVRLPAHAAGGATLRVTGAGIPETVARLDDVPTSRDGAGAEGAVRAAFGAERIRALEQLAASAAEPEALRAGLRRLGYDPGAVGAGGAAGAVYAENRLGAGQDAVRALLVRESLETGVPSAATAFVAVHAVAGRPAEQSVDVACALPAGWSETFVTRGNVLASRPASATAMVASMRPMGAMSAMPSELFADAAAEPSPAPTPKSLFRRSARTAPPRDLVPREIDEYDSMPAEKRVGGRPPALWDGIPADDTGEVVLYDSTTAADRGAAVPYLIAGVEARLTGDAGALPVGARLLLYVGDLVRPAARIDLRATLAAGGVRPTNVRRAPGARVRLVLELPPGAAWPAAAARLTVTLR